MLCVCFVCLVDMSWEQLHLDVNPYRPLLDQTHDYEGVLPEKISLEYRIEKMASKTYDWSYVAAGMNRIFGVNYSSATVLNRT